MIFQKKNLLLLLSCFCLLGVSSESFSADRRDLRKIEPFSHRDLKKPGIVFYLEKHPEVYLVTKASLGSMYESAASRKNQFKITLNIVDNNSEGERPLVVGEIVLNFFPIACDLLYGDALKVIPHKVNILYLSYILIGDTSDYGVEESTLTHLYGEPSGNQGKGIGTKAMKILFAMLSKIFPENSTLLLDCVKAKDSHQNDYRYSHQNDYRRLFYGKKLGMKEYDLGETYGSRIPKPFVRFVYNPKNHRDLPFQEELEKSILQVNLEGGIPSAVEDLESKVAVEQEVEVVQEQEVEVAPQGCCVIQ